MTAIEAINKELERLHEAYDMVPPWTRIDILKEISRINTRLLDIAKNDKEKEKEE